MTFRQPFNGISIKKAIGGIAVFDGDKTIYVNKNLYKYPKLLNKVLNHELEHYKDIKTESNALNGIKNMIKAELEDLKDKEKGLDLLLFSLKHPRAFLPYMIYGNQKIIIANQLFIFLWALALCGIIFFVISMIITS